ncbi:MAG: ABC transporter ATP-binding protein [Chloroflexi bacterium]|nr:ABC transporter ATP-binding protein [Chloroflexota bacterium]|tara:strand:- start:303 stop:1439 length:1137 start_codon:yes stop_codon:yes gene_type:complete
MKLSFNKFKRLSNEQERKIKSEMSSEDTGVIHLDDVTHFYQNDSSPTIENLNLRIKHGEFISILGESGAGKTTTLRMIAGFEKISSGYLRIGGQLVGSNFLHVPPNHRNLGVVFQDYALFPHMTVYKNIEFGISKLEENKKDIINNILSMVGMPGYENKYVHELSGGQQQRVAIARAIAINPIALLLDEPFSNLDRVLGRELRKDIKKISTNTETTTILVTHDREEALAISDRVAVVSNRKILQIDTPEHIYNNPLTPDVAKLVGPCDFIQGNYNKNYVETSFGKFGTKFLEKIDNSEEVLVLIRPSDVNLSPSSTNDKNALGRVISREYKGEYDEYEIISESGEIIHSRVNNLEKFSIDSKVFVNMSNERSVLVYKK